MTTDPQRREDIDSDPSVIFESGRQEANREWRKKLYERGGQELVEMLCKHYNKAHLINLIESA
jgi:hypothetical protein